LGGYGVLALGSRAALLKFALGKALPNFWQSVLNRDWLAAGVVGVLGNPVFTGADTRADSR